MPPVRAASHLVWGGLLLTGLCSAQDYELEELIKQPHDIAMKLAVEELQTDRLKGVIKHFLKEGVPIQDLCTSKTNTYKYVDFEPMHYAALIDRHEHIQELCVAGCDKDGAAVSGIAPTHVAAMAGSTQALRKLYDLGANPKKHAVYVDPEESDAPPHGFGGMNPATIAASNGKLEVLKLLKEFGAVYEKSLQEKDVLGVTPLQYAIRAGHKQVYLWLIFEVGWGTVVTKEKIVEAATLKNVREEVSKLASLKEKAFEKRRAKYLQKQAIKNSVKVEL